MKAETWNWWVPAGIPGFSEQKSDKNRRIMVEAETVYQGTQHFQWENWSWMGELLETQWSECPLMAFRHLGDTPSEGGWCFQSGLNHCEVRKPMWNVDVIFPQVIKRRWVEEQHSTLCLLTVDTWLAATWSCCHSEAIPTALPPSHDRMYLKTVSQRLPFLA